MSKKILFNSQTQLSSTIFGQNIKIRSSGLLIHALNYYYHQFKEQNINISLRGGGVLCPTSLSYNCFSDAQELEQIVKVQEVFKLILLRPGETQEKQKNETQEKQQQRVKQILQKVPKLNNQYQTISNEMLSLLILEQYGQLYEYEFTFQDQNNTSSLESLQYQYGIMNTYKQQKDNINNDQNMRKLKNLDESRNDLIENIKNIEMQLVVSEFCEFKEYSSLLIYQLQYYFEKLFWSCFKQDIENVLEDLNKLYEEINCYFNSQHIYNQWITLIANLYIFRPVVNQKYESTIFRELDSQSQRGILLFQKFESYNQQLLNDQNINTRQKIIQTIKDIKYLKFPNKEEQYFDDQISNKLFKRQKVAIQQYLGHIKFEQSSSQNSSIVKLKNIYINIMIDYIRILLSCNSIYNQLVNDFNNDESLRRIKNQFEVFQSKLSDVWRKMVQQIFKKIQGQTEQLNLTEDLEKYIQEIFQLREQQQIQQIKENKNCLVDLLNYFRNQMKNLLNVIEVAKKKLQCANIEEQDKSYNYLLIIFTYQLIQKLNNYKLINLKQILLQLMNQHHKKNIDGIKETINSFITIFKQVTEIEKEFENQQYLDSLLFQDQTKEEDDKSTLDQKYQQYGKQIISMLSKLTNIFHEKIQLDLKCDFNLIIFLLQSFLYPQQFRQSYKQKRQNENLVLQLIKVLTLCSESYIFEFAFEIFIDIWFENKVNKLMFNGKIEDLIKNMNEYLKFNIEHLKNQINLDNLKQKIVDQGRKYYYVRYVKNKIKSDCNQNQLEEELKNILMKFLDQFKPLTFDYNAIIEKITRDFNENLFKPDFLVELKSDMIIEQQLQDIENDKYVVDFMCINLNAEINLQKNNLKYEIMEFLTKIQSKKLIIYGKDGQSAVPLAYFISKFLWQEYKQTKQFIPIQIDVINDNFSEDTIKSTIREELNINIDINTEKKFVFVIIIYDQGGVDQVQEIIQRNYQDQKIIYLMKSEYLNLIQQNDQSGLVFVKIERPTIQQVLKAKLTINIINFLRKYEIFIQYYEFERIWNLLQLIINYNPKKNDFQLDDFEIDLIIEFLDYHFLIKQKCIETIYNKFFRFSFRVFFISKFILDFLSNIDFTDINQDQLKIFNDCDFSNIEEQNGIFKFLSNEIRIRSLGLKLLQLIKELIDKKDNSKALSNAFYLYSKIFGEIKDENLQNLQLQNINLEGCSFYKVNFNNSEFKNVNITNCNFVQCSLENVKWENLEINNFSKLNMNPQYLLLSKNGEWLIYYEENDNINRIYKREIRSQTETKHQLQYQATSIAISNNDQTLAIGSNQTILLLNAQNFEEIDSIQQQKVGNILFLVFIQTDKQLIYFNSNNQIVLYNISTKQINVIAIYSRLNAIAFSDQNNVVTYGYEKIIKYFNCQEQQKGDPIQLIELFSKVLILKFQSQYLISCCENGHVQFWDISSKINIRVIQLYNAKQIFLSPKGKFIVQKDHQNYIKLYDLEYPEIVYSFNGNYQEQSKVSFSEDEQKLVIDQQVWDISNINENQNYNINCIEISPNGIQYAISQSSDILICDSRGGLGIDNLKGHTGAVNAIAYSSDGMQLVSAGEDNQVIYWDTSCYQINKHLYHRSSVLSVAISDDKKYIVSGEINGIIILQRIYPWEKISEINASNQKINSLSFDKKSLFLLSGHADSQIKLWEITKQGLQKKHIFKGHIDEVRCVTFSEDGKRLASCSNDKSIKLWDLAEKQQLYSINGHRDHVIKIKFHSNNYIWSCSKDKTIKLWDLEQNIMIIKLDSNNSNLKSFALYPDKTRLLSLSDDQSIKLWNLNGYYPECYLKQFKTIVALPPNGNIFAYSGNDNIISLLDVTTKKHIKHLQIKGTANQLLFQGETNLIYIIKDSNIDQIYKWNLENNNNELLGEGSTIALSFDQQYLAYAKEKTLNIKTINNNQQNSFDNEINFLCFYETQNILACVCNNKKIIVLWNYIKQQKQSTITFLGEIKLCSFTADGEWFVFGNGNYSISFIQTKDFGANKEFQLSADITYKHTDTGKKISNFLITHLNIIVQLDNEIQILKPPKNNEDEIIPQSKFFEQNQILSIAASLNGKNLIVSNSNFSIDYISIDEQQQQQYQADIACYYSNGVQLLMGCKQQIEIIDLYNSNDNKQKQLDFNIRQIILSQKENCMAIADEQQIIILDQNLEEKGRICEELNSIKSIAFYSNDLIAYVCKEELKCWNIKDQKNQDNSFQKQPQLIQFFKTGNLFIVTNNELIVFDLETRKEKKTLQYENYKILVIALSKDETIIATGCNDNTIRLWDYPDLKQSCKLSGSSVICLDFHPKGEELAAIGDDNTITIWSIQNKCKIYQIKTDNSSINCINYNPIKNELVLSGNNNQVYFWKIHLSKLVEHHYLIEENIINYSISSDGNKLAIQSVVDNNIYIQDIQTDTSIEIIENISTQQYLKLSYYGNKLAYFSWKDFSLNVYDLKNKNIQSIKDIHKSKIITLDFCKNEKSLIIGYSDRTIQYFKDQNSQPIEKQSDSYIKQLTFHDKDLIVQLNSDKKLFLLKLISKQYSTEIEIVELIQENVLRIKTLEENKLLIQKAGQQFEILDYLQQKIQFMQPTEDQIKKYLINNESSGKFSKYRIGFIEQNPKCRTFPIIISKINQASEFTQKSEIKINEYFNRQFI